MHICIYCAMKETVYVKKHTKGMHCLRAQFYCVFEKESFKSVALKQCMSVVLGVWMMSLFLYHLISYLVLSAGSTTKTRILGTFSHFDADDINEVLTLYISL